MAASANHLRIPAALCRFQRGGCQGREAYIDNTFVLRLRAVRLQRSSRAGLPEDDLAPHLRKVHGAPPVHKKGDQQHILQFIYETERHNGIVNSSKFSGASSTVSALPLGGAQSFPPASTLPLHKPKCVAMYHQQFVLHHPVRGERSQTGGCCVERPFEILACDEQPKGSAVPRRTQEVLELTQAAEFVKTMLPLFRRISTCINSSHFQVVERARSCE